MADAVVSALVDQFVSRSLQKIEEEVRLVKNAKKDVEKLKKSLRLIQALLEDAGKKQLESARVKEWLSDLEDTSYDMDDVLDEWNAAILKLEIEKEAAGRGSHDEQKKVCFPMPSACFCFKQKVKEVISLRDFAKRIKELNEELDRTKKEGNDLGIVARAIEPFHHKKATAGSASKPRISTSLVDETKVHGRDQDKAVLVSKLLCESSGHKGTRIDVIPIVGMGGLGKTTLAQIAYNDDSVKAHFDKRIWVCVSNLFDLIKIAKAIVEGLGGNPQSYGELEALVQCISESVSGKKFLLVLDDVWSKDKEMWEQLNQPLKYGAPGSRILVTTRNMEVAMMLGVSTHMISSLETLSDEQCWSIIKQLTFVEEESKEFAQLEVVGKRIASKCTGLPLIAKILGSLMCFKKSKTQWEDILQSQLWESRFVDEIFAPFLLSYYDLSPYEKCCFSYCSVFPKDYRIERDMIIEIWISQGYVNDLTKGQDCFESLARRSFFQEFEINEDDGSLYSCKLHDIVHDFSQYLTKDKCVIMEGSTMGEKIESLGDKARHLTLLVDASSQLSPVLKSSGKNMTGNKLRTLLVVPGSSNIEVCDVEFLNLTCLRTWTTLNFKSHMGSTQGTHVAKFPQNLSMLIHLRYLDLSYRVYLMELPDSVCDLYNLQTLRIIACVALQRLPKEIGKLVNLRHLYIDECYSLEGFPKGIGKLTCLQKLDALVMPENKETCFHVDDLKKLSHLQFRGSLSINRAANFGNAIEAEKVNLKNMEDLDTLNLVFGEPRPFDQQEGNEAEAMILEALKPHPNLKNLLIWYYKGITMSPGWITSLTNLRVVRLMDCGCCEILPPLGKLPSLESLEIGPMRSLKKIGLEFLGITRSDNQNAYAGSRNEMLQLSFVSFPKLKKLHLDTLSQWKEWEGINVGIDSGLKIMPSLRSLTIELCNSLEALPEFLETTPLQDLSIQFCKILEKWCQEGMGKEWLKSSHIKNVQLLHEYVKKDGVWI